MQLAELTPAQAHRKLLGYSWSLFEKQFETRWVIRDVRSDVLLKNEIRAYWEGRIYYVGGWTDVLGQVKDAILGPIRSAIDTVWDRIIRPGVSALLSGLGWIAEQAMRLISPLIDAVRSVVGWIWDKVLAIWDAVKNVTSTIWDAIKSVGGIVAGALKGFFDWIWSGITAIGGKIWEGVTWVKDRTVEAFSAAWDSMRSWLGRIMGEIIDAIKAAFSFVVDGIKAAVGTIWESLKWFWDNVLVPAGQAVIKGVEWIWKQISDIVTGIMQAILNICSSWAPMTPERTPSAFLEILKIGAGGVMGLAGLTLAGEAVHPLKQLGFPHVSAMIYDLSSYKIITGAAMGALGFCMFKQPMTYFFSNLFRPRMPDKRDIIEARSRGLIDEARAKRMLGYVGFSDDYYPIWEDFSKTPLKYFALRAVAAAGFYDREFFDVDMKRSGYPEDARTALHTTYFSTSIETVTRPVITELQKRFINCYLTESEYDEELKGWYIPEAQRPHYIRAGHVLRDLKLRDQLVKNALDAYERGAIEDVGLLQALGEANVSGELAQRILLNERQKRGEDKYQTREEEIRGTCRGTVTKRFKEGLIDEAQFRQEMQLLGYTPPQIERYLIVSRLEYDYDFAMDLLATAKDAYSKGLIDDAGFLDWLARIPVGAERAQTYLMREQIRKAKKIAS